MPEYQNIMTRMLGADSFPYRNVTVTKEVFAAAVEALEHFFFVGIQEEFSLSSAALAREMGLSDGNVTVLKEREQQGMKQIKQRKAELIKNEPLMKRLREVNNYDIQLYNLAIKRFCQGIAKHADLFDKLVAHGKVDCHNH